jgi:diaminopimelate epimerase
VGNPHCVLFVDELSREEVSVSGPIFERNTMFPSRTNGQFGQIIDENNIAIEIWERGVGYTLASCSNACQVFAVAKKANFCSDNVKIHMPRGISNVELSKSKSLIQSGPIENIATCSVDATDFT